jgi:AraC-like DNA-binding protein
VIGFVVEDARAGPGERFQRHRHRQPHICVLVEGEFAEAGDDGRVAERTAGAVRISAAGTRHDIEFGRRGAHCVLIHLDPLRFSPDQFGTLSHSGLFLQGEPFVRLAIESETLPDRDGLVGLVGARLGLLELLARAGRETGAPSWLAEARAEARAAIETGSRAALISIAAERAGRHRGHLARVHREYYGSSMREYLLLERLRRAIRLIREPERPLAEAALECGYADQSHMTREFTRTLGLSPSAARGWERENRRSHTGLRATDGHTAEE